MGWFKNKQLSEAEQRVEETTLRQLLEKAASCTPNLHPIVVGMVGFPGSGKSHVAKQVIAPTLEAVIISSDDIRLELSSQGATYNAVNQIAYNLAGELLKLGVSVVLDSDHANLEKQAWLAFHAFVLWRVDALLVRPMPCLDVMLGRRRNATPHPLFQAATTAWKGKDRAHVVLEREALRRLQFHMRWSRGDGGQVAYKPLRLRLVRMLSIDTSEDGAWEEPLAQQLRSFMQRT